MGRVRWWIVGVVLAVGLVTITWRATSGEDEDPLAATLTDIQLDSSKRYAFPEWATDGATPVRLGAEGEELVIANPVAAREDPGSPRLYAVLPGGAGAESAAVATLPGGGGVPWVAVGIKPKTVSLEDLTTTERPLAWTGSQLTSGLDPVSVDEATSLSVELRSNESSGAIITADAAIARFGEADLAVVTTRQLDSGSLHVCKISDCRWESGTLPQGTAVDEIASTAGGFVAVTQAEDDQAAIWYAGDAGFRWSQIGSAPRGTTLSMLQDGEGVAILVWVDRDAGEVVVQTVRDGELTTDVPRTPVDGKAGGVSTALQVDERWYLGGARPSTARVSLRYRAEEPVLWELRDETWVPLGDALLTHQPDQSIQMLFTDAEEGLRAVSSSPVARIAMTWRFTRAAD